MTACLGLFTARWVPMPDAAHGWLTLLYVLACASLVFTPVRATVFSDRSGPGCEATDMRIARRMANKVPEVTVYFWIIKVLATTVGETAADLLNMNLGLGLTWTTVVVAALTAGALTLQLRSGRYVPWRYWLVVILISVVGTLVTDNLVDNFGVPLEFTTAVFAVALAATFASWYTANAPCRSTTSPRPGGRPSTGRRSCSRSRSAPPPVTCSPSGSTSATCRPRASSPR